ncbi:MAG: hypothetical protein WDN28_13910 [Chthoniobacter sp.]
MPPLPQPLPANASPGAILQALLNRPGHLIADIHLTTATRLPWVLGLFAVLALAAYGLVIGSFSGGVQWWSAPLKVSLGALASAAICLPSFFIFLSLSGADVSLRSIVGALCATLALTALLLIGLVPVAWVFSQSSDSVAFIGALHIVFWLIALAFGLRLLRRLLDYLRIQERLHLKAWTAIFIFVTLQMTTALRPDRRHLGSLAAAGEEILRRLLDGKPLPEARRPSPGNRSKQKDAKGTKIHFDDPSRSSLPSV